MANSHYLALSWRDTKIVNYFTNFHSPNDLAIQQKREKGKINKESKLIPSKINNIFYFKY